MKNRLTILFSIFFSLTIMYSFANSNVIVDKNISFENILPPTISPTNSLLKDGKLFKIAVNKDGMVKITPSFLKDNFGLENLNPNKIHILGFGGGSLPQAISIQRTEDWVDIQSGFSGNDDDQFQSDEFIYFYGEGPDKWEYSENNNQLYYKKNIYASSNYYIIKIDNSSVERISTIPSVNNPEFETNSYLGKYHWEEDHFNLLHDFEKTQGSGQQWFGKYFNASHRTYDFNFKLKSPVPNTKAKFKIEFAGRSTSSSQFQVKIGNQTFDSGNITSISTFRPVDSPYANIKNISKEFDVNGNQVNLEISYPGSETKGWLDYISIFCEEELIFDGSELNFSQPLAINKRTAYIVKGLNNSTKIWDISSGVHPKEIEFNANQEVSFTHFSDTLSTFICFNPNNISTPTAIGEIPNQNLHGLQNIDMLIVYHPDFEEAATQLQKHREQHNNFTVAKIPVQTIYNEFSSCRQDATAIRDFARYLKKTGPNFKFLLLFGDGSFDNRDIYNISPKSNFIPVFESKFSLSGVGAFPTDDYFALISDDEGANLNGDIDIAIGRIPIMTNKEGLEVVNKIIHYETNTEAHGLWKNKFVFVGDDEDTFHIPPLEQITNGINDFEKNINVEKIYIDAYPQLSTSGGEKYPEVTDEINKTMFQGAFVVNYMGHGGSKGWAQERILRHNDINSWKNFNHLPLFITATCSFSGFDDPNFRTAGERVFLNPKGGAIGLFTTLRAVYPGANAKLTQASFDELFSEAYIPYLGEILRRAKNDVTFGNNDVVNTRKFALIGDPATKLMFPRYKVVATKINSHNVETTQDTLKALQTVTIEGEILDDNDIILDDFTGTLFATIYDKFRTLQTLQNDEESPLYTFKLQNNIIFNGSCSVENGHFSIDFVVPLDIDLNYGLGKISFYATDHNTRDANGYYDDIIVGGIGDEIHISEDGPFIKLFMNDTSFINGGLTDENPILLVKLKDDLGINVTGNSIGHDPVAILDNNDSYKLNAYYKSKRDKFTEGEINFPLYNIKNGKHRIDVSAWNTANSFSTSSLEFYVEDTDNFVIEDLFCYPNPFSNQTTFSFEHNILGDIKATIDIYSVTGQLIQSLKLNKEQLGYRNNTITWNGGNGTKLGSGMYHYQLTIEHLNNNKKSVSDVKNLILMR